jgi:NAD(P)-dependent dehydrogenase (short-subunit alcohol dehydrogenase family)
MGVQAITRLRRSADRSTWHRVDLTEGLAMILVTGATGTVGRPLIELLASEGVKVRAVTHNPQAAGLPAGVEIAEGDPARPDTIALCWRASPPCSCTTRRRHPRRGQAAGADYAEWVADHAIALRAPGS